MEKSHKKLKVWQESMSLVKLIYEKTSTMPKEEKFGLIQQMRRASVSIPSNIAEGSARTGSKESLQFYLIARASLSELDTQVELCISLGLLNKENCASLFKLISLVDSLLSGLIRYKRSKV
jgi:four helix bundle protein